MKYNSKTLSQIFENLRDRSRQHDFGLDNLMLPNVQRQDRFLTQLAQKRGDVSFLTILDLILRIFARKRISDNTIARLKNVEGDSPIADLTKIVVEMHSMMLRKKRSGRSIRGKGKARPESIRRQELCNIDENLGESESQAKNANKSRRDQWIEIVRSWRDFRTDISVDGIEFLFRRRKVETALLKQAKPCPQLHWGALSAKYSDQGLDDVFATICGMSRSLLDRGLLRRGYGFTDVTQYLTLHLLSRLSIFPIKNINDKMDESDKKWIRLCAQRLQHFEYRHTDEWFVERNRTVPKNCFGWPDWEWLLKYGEPRPFHGEVISVEFLHTEDDVDQHVKDSIAGIRTDDREMAEVLRSCSSNSILELLFCEVKHQLDLHYCKVSKAKIYAFMALGLSPATGHRYWKEITQLLNSHGYK